MATKISNRPTRDVGTPFAPLLATAGESWIVRLPLGLALGLLGALAHAALMRAMGPALSLAAVYPCFAVAVLLGGATSALACLAVLSIALWRLTPPANASEGLDIALLSPASPSSGAPRAAAWRTRCRATRNG